MNILAFVAWLVALVLIIYLLKNIAFVAWLVVPLSMICLWKTTKIYPVTLSCLQYLLLFRVPIIAGLFLFFFPCVAINQFPLFFGNLFVMHNFLQLIWTIIGTALASLMVSVVFYLIFINAPERYSEVLKREINDWHREIEYLQRLIKKYLPEWVRNLSCKTEGFPAKNIFRYGLAIILASPTLVITVTHSFPEVQPKNTMIRTLVVILLSVLIFIIVHQIRNHIDNDDNKSIIGEFFLLML